MLLYIFLTMSLLQQIVFNYIKLTKLETETITKNK